MQPPRSDRCRQLADTKESRTCYRTRTLGRLQETDDTPIFGERWRFDDANDTDQTARHPDGQTTE